MSRLKLICDGNNLLLRSRAALPDLRAKTGEPTGGVYGTILMFTALYKQFKFSDSIFCFDWGKSLYRLNIRKSYKGNRLTVEREDAAPQFRLLEEFLSIIQVPYCRIEGVEADDTMASLAKQSKMDTIVVTGDHDLLQVIRDRVIIAKPSLSRGAETLVDSEDVIAKYGFPPNRLAEIWAQTGEIGDGVEGVRGIGPKTAIKILKQHGDLWTAIRNEPKLAGHEKLLEENYRLIDLANGSSGIHIEDDFDSSFDANFYPSALRDYFKRLDMNTMCRRFDQQTLWTT